MVQCTSGTPRDYCGLCNAHLEHLEMVVGGIMQSGVPGDDRGLCDAHLEYLGMTVGCVMNIWST